MSANDTVLEQQSKRPKVSTEQDECFAVFQRWSDTEQVNFVCQLLSKVSHFQQSEINRWLEPVLKRDFVVAFLTRGVPHLADRIFRNLDDISLLAVEQVSRDWQWTVAKFQLWRHLLADRVNLDLVWYGLAERRGWLDLIFLNDPSSLPRVLEDRRRAAKGLRNQRPTDSPLLPSSSTNEEPVNGGMTPLSSSNASELTAKFESSSAFSGPPEPNNFDTHPAGGLMLMQPDNDSLQSSSTANSPVWESHLDSHLKFTNANLMFAHRFYKQFYPRFVKEIKRVEENWVKARYHLTRIACRSNVTKGVYCLQYDKEKIVSGLRDDTIKVWRRQPTTSDNRSGGDNQSDEQVPPQPIEPLPAPQGRQRLNGEAAAGDRQDDDGDDGNVAANPAPVNNNTANAIDSGGYRCTQVLQGHTGSVLCLQYRGNLLISGSSDTNVRLWDLETGQCLKIVPHHTEAVLHLRFSDKLLVTCSKDRSIAVWDIGPQPCDVQLRQVLVSHRAAVNVVDFDEKYIVSASGDRTIKVWHTDSCAHARTLTGHRRGIACLQYRDHFIVSGSSDNTIRVWDIETGDCLRTLEGHEELVRCIRFDSKRIVSGAYDGKIKVWDFQAALAPRSKPNQLCLQTFHQHTGRVFRLQFDDFQIVSSSHDDTILIWDFTRPSPSAAKENGPDDEDDDGFDDDAFLQQYRWSTASTMPLPASNNADRSTTTSVVDLDSSRVIVSTSSPTLVDSQQSQQQTRQL